MTIDNRNATSSWSGYNHQGKIGIFLALKELQELIENETDYTNYKLEFEKNGGEDIEIGHGPLIISRHQVKAKKNGTYPNDYSSVRKINSPTYPTGFQTEGTTEQNRFLHVICEVNGWDLNREDFLERYSKANYVENESKVRLYTYPDDRKYCELRTHHSSPIDEFCITLIKNILNSLDHCLKNDEYHIEETLLEIKDLISKKISEAHDSGHGAYPIVYFWEIYELVTSQVKRQSQSIRRAKELFELYWNDCVEDCVDASIFNEILNLPDEVFQKLLIDLHPDRSIFNLLRSNNIDNLIDENNFRYIFYNFIKECKNEKFLLRNLRYDINQDSFRLSMINIPLMGVNQIIQKIMNNRDFLSASFDTRYLVNMSINKVKLIENTVQDFDEESECSKLKNSIFSNDLELIGIEKTVSMLRGDRDE